MRFEKNTQHCLFVVFFFLLLLSLFSFKNSIKNIFCKFSVQNHNIGLNSYFATLFSMKSLGCPRGVMFKVREFGTIICEFENQSRYYVHFQTNTLGKGVNPLILPAMG